MNGIPLRPYQTAAINATGAAFLKGKKRTITVLPTGCGKTIMGMTMAKSPISKSKRVLWIAHREELLDQAAKSWVAVCPEDPGAVGIVQADRNDWDSRLLIGSIQTLSVGHRLDKVMEAGGFGLVVVDEAHHATAKSYLNVLDRVGIWEPDGPPLVGLTATCERGDQVRLDGVFDGGIAYQFQLLQAIKDGYLVDFRFMKFDLVVNMEGVRTTKGDFNEADLGHAMVESGAPDATCNLYIKHGEDRKAICFTASVEQAELTAKAMQEKGIKADFVSGKTPTAKRHQLLKDFKDGVVQVVCNCGVLTEGFDEPTVSCIILARPTKSKSMYIQMLGRGLRLCAPWKKDCLVLDVTGASEDHTIIQAPVLFGLPEDAGNNGKTPIGELAEELPADVNEPKETKKPKRKKDDWANWIEIKGGYAASAAEHGLVVVRCIDPAQNAWVVDLLPVDRSQAPQRLTAVVWKELAMGVGLDVLRRAKNLVDVFAPWRTRPASDKQVNALRKWNVMGNGMTAGEASDMMTRLNALAAIRRLDAMGA